MDFSLAAKAFIINNNDELLLVKRSETDPHEPGAWEVPGGRLNQGENPFEGLKRETKEETNLDIDVLNPLRVHHFTRADGQKITMVAFLCRPLSDNLRLSREHSEHLWADLDDAVSKIHPAFHKDLEIFKNYFLDR